MMPKLNPSPILPLDEEWDTQQQSVEVPVVERVAEEQNAQPGHLDIECVPMQCMEEASDASSSSDEESNSESNAAAFATSGQVCCIDSNVCLGINTVSHPENLVHTTLD